MRWVDVFSSDELIISYFLNVHCCEIVTTKRWADAEYMTPYDFLVHDIGHRVSDSCTKFTQANLAQFYKFYTFCKRTLDKENFRKIRVYFFIQIHESNCYIDPYELVKGKPVYQHLIDSIDDDRLPSTFGYYAARIKNERDLSGLIPADQLKISPKDILELIPEDMLESTLDTTLSLNPTLLDMEPSDILKMDPEDILKLLPASIIHMVTLKKIKLYLLECIHLYIQEYDKWNKSSVKTMSKTLKLRKHYRGSTFG